MARRANSDVYDKELEWLLLEADHAIGNVSGMGGFIATQERNGGHVSPDPDRLFRLTISGVIGMYRRTFAAWLLVPHRYQQILLAHYVGRLISNVGERRRRRKRGKLTLVPWLPPELQQALQRARNGELVVSVPERAPEVRESWQRWPLALESRLGEFAGAAVQLSGERGLRSALLAACKSGDTATVERWAKQARKAVVSAHTAWREAQRQGREARTQEWLNAG